MDNIFGPRFRVGGRKQEVAYMYLTSQSHAVRFPELHARVIECTTLADVIAYRNPVSLVPETTRKDVNYL